MLSGASCSSLGVMEKFHSVSLVSEGEALNSGVSEHMVEQDELPPQTASQILWATGSFSGTIPNGFYSIIPEKKLKELYCTIPSLDELQSMGGKGIKADIILVDAEKDKKLLKLKQLIVALVKGLKSNPALMIKKIVGLVSDCYRRQNSESSPAKTTPEEIGHVSEANGVRLLGQIRHGSCWPRAILFKVLADAAGLQSKLMVGLPSDGDIECSDLYKHMSVVVLLSNMVLLVDLMRFPGQLVPLSPKSVFRSHIYETAESDSAENDSCDSPLEPNSPLCSMSDKLDYNGAEQHEHNHTGHSFRPVPSNTPGPSSRSIMLQFAQGKPCPDHPLLGAQRQFMLRRDRQCFRKCSADTAASRLDGTTASNMRRTRRRSVSITPEIGDDIVRAVRAMNETLKQKRLSRDQIDSTSAYFTDDFNRYTDPSRRGNHDVASREGSSDYNNLRKQLSLNEKVMSLPSSPRKFTEQTFNSEPFVFNETADSIETWNKVLQSSSFLNKPLLPFEEWRIDFSELTVGTRIGIGFFGEVFHGVWNGTDVAIKVFLEQDLTAEKMEDFCNEIYILSCLRHPNVILFLGACTVPPHVSMITEYMERGSLYYLIHLSRQKKKLSWRRRFKMLVDICRGLMCIHRMNIVHRDLKSANCLVNEHWTVKICDFGLSRVMHESPMKDSASAGTPEWMAPELIRSEPFTEKCDIFSLGVIMWELCTLSRPWEGVPPVQVVYEVANEGARLEIPEGPLGKLITDCWAEPKERPSCEEVFSRLLDCEYALR